MTTPTSLLRATTMICAILAAGGGCQYMRVPQPPGPTAEQQHADQLARSAAMASGGAVWPRVTSVSFNFVVREGSDVKVNRSHLWNVCAGSDTVASGADKGVTIDTNKPAPADDAAQAAAFKAWTNDTYWLIAPLKLFEPGVTREYLGQRDVAGKTYETLRLSFQGVGMTPGDKYDLYIDPLTSLIAFWDYMPNDQTTMRATWEKYQHPSGLKLSTYHTMGTKTITIENLSVEME